ncbi:hypothetical protein RCN09_18625, partial [Escherichia marmotae]|nr:hypothetical protein [Escherichia marmotae]
SEIFYVLKYCYSGECLSRDDRELSLYYAWFFANVSSGHIHLPGFIPEYVRILERRYVSDMHRFKDALRDQALHCLATLVEQKLADVIVPGVTQELSFVDMLQRLRVPLLVI